MDTKAANRVMIPTWVRKRLEARLRPLSQGSLFCFCSSDDRAGCYRKCELGKPIGVGILKDGPPG
jgi:hypothetical protein